MHETKTLMPKWYWILCGFLLLWNLAGVAAFYQHISISKDTIAALPLNEQELYSKFPVWTKFVFAIAVFGGLAGALSLLLRRKVAKTFFVLSIVALMIQMGHSLFIAKSVEVYGMEALIVPILTLLIGIFSIWFSDYDLKKDYLK